MKKSEMKKFMEVYGDCFYKDTCYKLQIAMLKKIINHKDLDDFTKVTLVNQYTSNLITNDALLVFDK